jgi:hypothetical protein
MKVRKIILTVAMSGFLMGLAAKPANAQDAESMSADSASATQTTEPASAQQPQPQTAQELQQLVAPIALYPDALVAQVLAGAGHPTEIVEADRFMQGNTDTDTQKRAQEVNDMPWDPSVKALTQFPSVLQNMDKNLSWTSQLGEAYETQPQDVMTAVQFMRQQAQKSGNLTSNSQQTVSTQGSTIVIQPASTEVVYVPAYNPWAVYGYPIGPWPGWVSVPGIFYAGPTVYWGFGWGVHYYGGFGWGWNHWGYNWGGGGNIIYNNNVYINNTHTYINNNNWHSNTWNNNNWNNNHGYSPNGWHGGGITPGGGGIHPTPGTPANGNNGWHGGGGGFAPSNGGNSEHGLSPDNTGWHSNGGWNRSSSGFGGNSGWGRSSGWGGGMSSGAFSGFNRGGNAGGFASRGAGSFGGGGRMGGFRR